MLNNPLKYVDPSGYQSLPPWWQPGPDVKPPGGSRPGVGVTVTFDLNKSAVDRSKQRAQEPAQKPQAQEKSDGEGQVPATGAKPTPTATDTTPPPASDEPQKSWTENPIFQAVGGFVAGVAIGAVPFGGTGAQVATAAGVIDKGTREARIGRALGEMVGGAFITISGIGLGTGGVAASATGAGAAAGVPALVVSAGLVVGGVANMASGLAGLQQALMSQGSGGGDAAEEEAGNDKKPTFKPNPAHTPGQRGFNPRKTVEPSDSGAVFKQAIPGKDGHWYGKGGGGEIYRYFSDNRGGAHFSGMTGSGGIPLDRIPIEVRRALGVVR